MRHLKERMQTRKGLKSILSDPTTSKGGISIGHTVEALRDIEGKSGVLCCRSLWKNIF